MFTIYPEEKLSKDMAVIFQLLDDQEVSTKSYIYNDLPSQK